MNRVKTVDRNALKQHILENYAASSDFPWISNPTYEVFRHGSSGKWFALVMEVPCTRLGLPGERVVTIVNLKCDPLLIGTLRTEPGIYPAYHMSKEHWISVELAEVDEDKLRFLVDMSWELT